jgi:hypothetical protein
MYDSAMGWVYNSCSMPAQYNGAKKRKAKQHKCVAYDMALDNMLTGPTQGG